MLDFERHMINKARNFAKEYHNGQRYGYHSYIFHLDSVVDLVLTQPYNVQVVAMLHDVLEDTPATFEMLELEFSTQVAFCVQMLTDPNLKNRKSKKFVVNNRFRLMPAEPVYDIIRTVKCADRIANIFYGIKTNNIDMLKMYKKEHHEFMICVPSTFQFELFKKEFKKIDKYFRKLPY